MAATIARWSACTASSDPSRRTSTSSPTTRSREAIAIDTATPSLAWIADELAARDWTLKLIVSTHGHWDHIGDNAVVAEHTGADIAVHALDRDRLTDPQPIWAPFEIVPSVPAVDLAEGGRHPLRRASPAGPAHAGPHGRLGLPAGRGRGPALQRRHAVRGRVGEGGPPGRRPGRDGGFDRQAAGLEDHIGVFPGHGAATTIGRERALAGPRPQRRQAVRVSDLDVYRDRLGRARTAAPGPARRSALCTWPTCAPSRSRTPASSSASRSSSTRIEFVHKLGVQGRGGFCYELNGAFERLLRSIGFEVAFLEARGHETEGRLGPRFDHLALRVTLDEPWLVDVGFGYSFVEPLRLIPGIEQADPDRCVPPARGRRRAGPRVAPSRRPLGPALPARPGPARAGRLRRDRPLPPDRARLTVHAGLELRGPDARRGGDPVRPSLHRDGRTGTGRARPDGRRDRSTSSRTRSASTLAASTAAGSGRIRPRRSGLRTPRRHRQRRIELALVRDRPLVASRSRAVRTGRGHRSGSPSPPRASHRSCRRPASLPRAAAVMARPRPRLRHGRRTLIFSSQPRWTPSVSFSSVQIQVWTTPATSSPSQATTQRSVSSSDWPNVTWNSCSVWACAPQWSRNASSSASQMARWSSGRTGRKRQAVGQRDVRDVVEASAGA